MSKRNYCIKVGHKAANCWKLEANKDKRLKNWEKKEEKEVGASNIEVLLECTKASTIDYTSSEPLFEIDLCEIALQKLEEIPIPSNPLDDNKNGMGNINMEESKKDDEKGSSGTECCLSKIEKLVIPAQVALLQSANIWVGDLGASVHCTNNRQGGSNIYKGSGAGNVGVDGEAMTISSVMDFVGTWCNKFGKEQLKSSLKDVQYNPKSNFNLFSIRKAIKEGCKLSGDKKGLVLTKGNAKLVFDIKIPTKNGVVFCAYLQREYEITAILASTCKTMSTEKAHRITWHHDEEQTHRIALELE